MDITTFDGGHPIKWALAQRSGSMTVDLTLIRLAAIADNDKKVCMTNVDLSAHIGCSRPTIIAALKVLKAKGLIDTTQERQSGGEFKPQVITLTPGGKA